jgi:hypothetical protein
MEGSDVMKITIHTRCYIDLKLIKVTFLDTRWETAG